MMFDELLKRAKNGDEKAQEELFILYRPLLIKNAISEGVFDNDLYQELWDCPKDCVNLQTDVR